ncbi:MAG: glycosyltransferase family 1 protein, partial [Patescibacteria group bacterium]
MILGIDGNEANVEHRVGVSWCAYYLLKEFQKKTDKQLQIRVFLRKAPLKDMPLESEYFKYNVVKGPFLWSQIFLPLSLHLRHRDLSVFLSLAHYAPRFCPVPSVVVLHDLSYYYYPDDFLKRDLYQLVEWTKYSVKNASKVITVSESTRNDALLLYQLPEDKVVTVHNGITLPTKYVAEGEGTINLQKPYFLYVGTLQPRKNIINLIYAFDRFAAVHPDQHLYIVGKRGWLYDEFYKLVSARKLEGKVHFTGYVSETDRLYLLKNAQAFIAPEFYGGFGLTIPEAQSVGT